MINSIIDEQGTRLISRNRFDTKYKRPYHLNQWWSKRCRCKWYKLQKTIKLVNKFWCMLYLSPVALSAFGWKQWPLYYKRYLKINSLVWKLLHFDFNLFQEMQLANQQHWFIWLFGAEQTASHYLNLWRPSLLMDICVTRPRPRWIHHMNSHHTCTYIINDGINLIAKTNLYLIWF